MVFGLNIVRRYEYDGILGLVLAFLKFLMAMIITVINGQGIGDQPIEGPGFGSKSWRRQI